MTLRTGEEYLAGLRDGRQVVYDGRVIEDVTQEPMFRRNAAAIAQFFDFQNLAPVRDLMSFTDEEGERVGMAYLEPRSKEDLRRRAAAHAAWADVTCGLAGRSPDYMATMITSFAGLARSCEDELRALAAPLSALHASAARTDAYWTHTFVDPFHDHSKPPTANPTSLRVVRETSDALVVSGARGVATGGAVAELNLNFDRLRRLRDAQNPAKEGEMLALSFVLPVNAPGTRWLCRDVETAERSRRDSPLAQTADEIDAVAVFDEAEIPKDRVLYFAKDYAALFQLAQIFAPWGEQLTKHQTLIRYVAKTRLVLGLAHLMAEGSGSAKYINVQQRLGDIVLCLDVLEGLAVAAIEEMVREPKSGWYYPNARYASAGIRFFGEYYPRILDHLMMIGASRFVSTPQARTLELLGSSIDQYFRGGAKSAQENVSLYRMAWDLVGTSFGARHDLYERFFAGDYELQKVGAYVTFDKTHVIDMVKRMLMDAPGAPPFPLPSEYRTEGG